MYGNLNFDASETITLGSCPTAVCNPAVNAANNRLVGYSFDSAGNTTVDAEGRQFTYDAENKQTLVKDASNVTIGQYYYDGDGMRVKKTSNQENIVFVYDAAGKLVEEYSGSTLQTAYVYAGSRLLTTETSAGTNYLTNDHLGSPRINTNGSGNVTARHDYMPFGEEIYSYGGRTSGLGYTTDSVRKQFTTYERDNESNLDFAEARYYNPMHGRFTAVDPLFNSSQASNPQTLNRYTYALNNPMVFTDPTGLTPYWTYRDTVGEDGQTIRTFRRYDSEEQQEAYEAVHGGGFQRWTGADYYVFGDGSGIFLGAGGSGQGLRFSTSGISQEALQGIFSTQESGGAFSEQQQSMLLSATIDAVLATPEWKKAEAVASIAGGGLGAGAEAGASSFLRNVAFGTQRNGAVFFSGQGTASVASEFAANTGRQTIGMTPGGSILNSVTGANVFGRPAYEVFPGATQRLWGWGSRHFAQGASGEVHFFGRAVSPNGVWSMTERQILKQNPDVFIRYHRIIRAPR